MIITIDGPAAAGKGTLASALAEKYKFAYFDTGMVYRAVGLQMILNHKDLTDENTAIKYASDLTFPVMMKLAKNPEFRSSKGGQAASIVSAIKGVRAALLSMQQNFALNPVFADGTKANGVVYDGRDTGTVVCPNADLKLFVTASPEVRAKRRYDEFLQKGMPAVFNDVLADIKARDERDSKRATAPLKPAEDAIIIDTSDMSINDVFAKVEAIIKEKRR
ncbi:MAG: (d)CMP kinase [Alphaproteobacteria bacterium]|nr:(d)CMP kinase [Alphaproteobacteria bacterium]